MSSPFLVDNIFCMVNMYFPAQKLKTTPKKILVKPPPQKKHINICTKYIHTYINTKTLITYYVFSVCQVVIHLYLSLFVITIIYLVSRIYCVNLAVKNLSLFNCEDPTHVHQSPTDCCHHYFSVYTRLVTVKAYSNVYTHRNMF